MGSSSLDHATVAYQEGNLRAAEDAAREVFLQTWSAEALELLIDTLRGQDRADDAVRFLHSLAIPDDADPKIRFLFAKTLSDLEGAEERTGILHHQLEIRLPWGSYRCPAVDDLSPSHLPEATSQLRQILSVTPMPEAQALLGRLLIADSATRKEGVELIQAAAAHETCVDGHFAVVAFALLTANGDLAQAAIGKTLALAPDHAEALRTMRIIEVLTGSLEVASFDEWPVDEAFDLLSQLERWLSIAEVEADETVRLRGFAEQASITLISRAAQLIDRERSLLAGARLLSLATKYAPDLTTVAVLLGNLLMASGEFAAAETVYEQVLERDPASKSAGRYLNLVRRVQGKSTPSDPTHADLSAAEHLENGQVLCESLNFDAAIDEFVRAVQAEPGSVTARRHLAEAHYLHGRIDQATSIAEEAHALEANDAMLNSVLACCHLSRGNLARAWPLLESRLQLVRPDSVRPPPPLPVWTGEDLAGKTLLVWTEEGIGDEIRYSSILRDLRDRGADRIIWECSPRLVSLYRRSFPELQVRAECHNLSGDGIDFHIPVMSLALHFRGELSSFPASGQFLVPDQRRVAAWKQRLNALGDGPKIGIGLKSMNRSWKKRMTYTGMTDWDPLLGLEGCQFLDLQIDSQSSDVLAAAARTGAAIHRFDDLDLKNDLESVAALLSALDGVVSARCWLPTLAGSVGTRVFCVSPRPNPYMLELDRDPWAPETTVFYREPGENWSVAIENLVRLVQGFLLK